MIHIYVYTHTRESAWGRKKGQQKKNGVKKPKYHE